MDQAKIAQKSPYLVEVEAAKPIIGVREAEQGPAFLAQLGAAQR